MTVLGSISVSGGDTGRGPPALPVPGGGGAPPARPQPSAAVPAVSAYHPGIASGNSARSCYVTLFLPICFVLAMQETKAFLAMALTFI